MRNSFYNLNSAQDITDRIALCGIYFLCRNNEIQYIGQSIDVVNRTSNHRRNKIIPFNRIMFLACEENQLDNIEASLIRAAKPPYNGRCNGGILAGGNKELDQQILSEICSSATDLLATGKHNENLYQQNRYRGNMRQRRAFYKVLDNVR